jgi:hypothetical protein
MATLPEFRTRYPAFASVTDGTVEYWLGEGGAAVTAWPDDAQDKGAMAYAAHKLAEQGLDGATVGAGVTAFKSGTFSASFSDAVAMRTGYHATVYGREFLELARLDFAGPRTAVIPPVSL